MIKKLRSYLLIAMLAISFITWTTVSNEVSAQSLADGTYTINYTVLHSDNDSVSMANDYWEKPAKIIVNGGKMVMQMTINHSAWVTEFKVPSGGGYADVSVVSTDQATDKRVVQFPISDLSSPLVSKIHVTVTDIDYDHDYTIRFSFDTNSIVTVSQAEKTNSSTPSDKTEKNETTINSTNAKPINNPQTGDTTMISVFVLLFVVSGVYLIRRFRTREQ